MFRRFWAGQTVSLIGDQVSLIALPLVAVLVLDANAAQMGYLVAAELLPNLLFSLHAGAWADRRARKRRTMIATDLVRALLIGSIPVAYAFDALTFPHMLVVAFLMGTMTVLFHVSYSSFYPALVPRDRLVEGGSIMHGAALSPTSSARAPAVCSCRRFGSRDARRRRVLVRRLCPLPQVRRRRRAGQHPGGPRRLGRAWVFGNPIIRRRSARPPRSTSSTSSSPRLHPLCDDRARRLARELGLVLGAAAVAVSSARRHGPGHPLDRRWAGVRARVRPLSRAAAARPSPRDRTRSSSPASSSPSSAAGSA